MVNPELRMLHRTLERLSFCESATFYLADPHDPAVLGPGGKPRAVLQLYGNEEESFREYEAMFRAAKKAK